MLCGAWVVCCGWGCADEQAGAAGRRRSCFQWIDELLGDALTFPNPSDNSLRVGPVDLYQGGGLRGVLPGVLHSPQPLISSGSFATGIRIAGQGAYVGRTFEAITVGDPGSAAAGVVFVDITGPWGV